MSIAKNALQTLRDVDHSMGSFLIGVDNALVERDAPSYLDSETLSGVGRRVTNSLSSTQLQMPGVNEVALLFARGSLLGMKCRHGVIVLMGSGELHASTARIALAVCAHNLDAFESDALFQRRTEPAAAPSAPIESAPAKSKKTKKSIWA